MKQKFGSIYDYKKEIVSHETWLNETKELGHPLYKLKCCKGKTFIEMVSMSHVEFYDRTVYNTIDFLLLVLM